ncbi:MAG TPA: TetR/AcrR family transcriptional regulator [Solirubrobacteraceae bacterium]|nr:TetR/AcrR family transcriptional regulator [Solirubrobacteraceae bacterium]
MPQLLEQPRIGPTPGLPRGPHSLTREQVAHNQRLRLQEGMIDAIGEKGYAASTVSDVIKRAGVSRKAFYEHFANKEECFLATYDSIAAIGEQGVSRAFRRAEGLPDSVQAALGELFELAIARPEALRVLMVEIGAAGPAGVQRREQLVVRYEEFLRESLGLQPGPGPIPNPILRGVVGGILHVLYTHLRRGDHRQLRKRLPDLVRWTTAYWPAPASIMTFVDPTPRELHLDLSSGAGGWAGGRAPGSLSLGAATSRRRKLPRGENGMPRSFVVHSQRERILDAVTTLTASRGYAALTVEGIAAEASVSLQAFYEHFGDKEEAFLVAYEIGHDKALALVERAYDAELDWRYGVRAGITALFNFLAGEPAFAHMAMIDVMAASDRTSSRALKGAAPFGQMLAPGLARGDNGTRPPEVMVHAIAGGLFELMLHHALQSRIHELPVIAPRATYFALAPFIGADAAGEVATAPPA